MGFFDIFKKQKTEFERMQEEAVSGYVSESAANTSPQNGFNRVVSTQNISVQNAASHQPPVQEVKVQQAPNQQTPNQQAPVQEASVKTGPTNQNQNPLAAVIPNLHVTQKTSNLRLTINIDGEPKTISVTPEEMELISQNRFDEAKKSFSAREGLSEDQVQKLITLAKLYAGQSFMSGNMMDTLRKMIGQ